MAMVRQQILCQAGRTVGYKVMIMVEGNNFVVDDQAVRY